MKVVEDDEIEIPGSNFHMVVAPSFKINRLNHIQPKRLVPREKKG